MKREQWEKRLEDQAASGESIVGYCAKHGLNSGTFSYWKKQLQKPVADRFVAVGGEEVAIHLPGGTIIKSEVRHLSSILKAVGACAS